MWSGLMEGGRKLSVRCGNVWLGPDTQITTEVVGPECKGVGGRPWGGRKALSFRGLKSRETILTTSSTTPEWRCLYQ